MTENLHAGVTAAEPVRTPRTLTVDDMNEHIDNGHAIALKPARHAMFVRYDETWWIGDGRSFTEITSREQNSRLDRWRQRLTQGALWT